MHTREHGVHDGKRSSIKEARPSKERGTLPCTDALHAAAAVLVPELWSHSNKSSAARTLGSLWPEEEATGRYRAHRWCVFVIPVDRGGRNRSPRRGGVSRQNLRPNNLFDDFLATADHVPYSVYHKGRLQNG